MNSTELVLFDCLFGDDTAKRDRAMTILFFCSPGKVMSKYQKMAQDIILRNFEGQRYRRFPVREIYDTAMSCVIGKVINSFRYEKAKYLECNEPVVGKHWITDKYKNFDSYLSKVIHNAVNKYRPEIDVYFCDDVVNKISIPETVTIPDPIPDEGDDDAPKIDLKKVTLEAISRLKFERDRNLLMEIDINNVSEEEYATKNNADKRDVCRDLARARNRLIIELIPTLQKKMKSVVTHYSDCLNNDESSLLHDVIVNEYSINTAAKARGLRNSDAERSFSASYKKVIKEYNQNNAEARTLIGAYNKELDKKIKQYKKELTKTGAVVNVQNGREYGRES